MIVYFFFSGFFWKGTSNYLAFAYYTENQLKGEVFIFLLLSIELVNYRAIARFVPSIS